MAWIEKRKRGDGGVSAPVVWRLGGTRRSAYQAETFSVGSDAENLVRADGFKKMVDAAGQGWPEGWVRGEATGRGTRSAYSAKGCAHLLDTVGRPDSATALR